MTNIVVRILSEECIRPSSPTPQHLKNYKISLLDQFISSVYVPRILFYPMHSKPTATANFVNTCQRSELLKQSLSETLTSFYPLAGRVRDTLSVDCNDEGASYTEAEVESINLTEFLNHPDVSFLSQFLPHAAGMTEQAGTGAPIAMVQVTNFPCGGFVVGVLVSHMVLDGTAMSTFLKAWAARCCKAPSSAICKPCFDATSIFPQSNAFPKIFALVNRFVRMDKCASRRFVFDATAIAALKAEAAAGSSSISCVQNPTRVEVVTALIWKCVTNAFAFNTESTDGGQRRKRSTLITHTVNLRQRAVPPFSETCIGNFVLPAAATLCSSSTQELELGSLVLRMREAIKKVDGKLIESLQGDEGFTKMCELSKVMGDTISRAASDGALDYINFTSWCNFGLYDLDFGWGKPIWLSSFGVNASQSMFINRVILVDTRSCDGVEAWIYLGEQEMAVLEHDDSFLAFASIDHSPLEFGNSVYHP